MNLNIDVPKFLIPLAQFFGVLPLNYRNIKGATFGDYILILLNFLVYFGAITYGLYNHRALLYSEECKEICFVGNMTFLFLGIFVYSICFMSSLRKKKFFIHYFNELAEFDDRFTICNPIKKNILRRDWVKIIMSGIVVILLITAVSFDFYVSQIEYNWKSILILVVTDICVSYPLMSSSLMELTFALLIQEVGYRFEKINFLFKIINRECSKKIGSVKIFDIELNGKNEKLHTEEDNLKTKKPATNALTSTNVSNEKETDGSNKNDKNEELIDSDDDDDFDYDSDNIDSILGPVHESYNCERHMVELFNIHEKISTLGVVINKEYSIVIVAYMTATFVISIFGIFLATKVLFTIGGRNTHFDNMAISYVLWTAYLLVVAYLVLRLCCKAQTESRKTALLIHEIMQKKPSFMLGNDEYYNKMKCFTLQYLHWEQYFHFNGIGLFSLDYTFIFSAVSAATSYLIVLLQFDMTTVI